MILSDLQKMHMEMRIAHLAMIQGVVNRIATHSMQCKTYCVTLSAGFLAFFAQFLSNKLQADYALYFGIVAIVVFWLLDTWYLQMERGFRDFYNLERLKTNDISCDFEIKPLNQNLCRFFECLLSRSIIAFYFGLILAFAMIYQFTRT